MDNSRIYLAEHRHMQDVRDSRKLADRQEELIVHDIFTTDEIDFISSRDMFFLSTVNSRNEPTVSYKGGPVGFVVVKDNELVFPNYDGNGMYLSVGNLVSNNKVGLLFIDFETPRRLRVQGIARIDDGPDKLDFPKAEFLIRIQPTEIWVNCPRYIHTYKKFADSPYTPGNIADGRIAQWKRLDSIVDSLSETEKQAVNELGTITIDEYTQKIQNKDG